MKGCLSMYIWVDCKGGIESLLAVLRKAGCTSFGFPVEENDRVLWQIFIPDDEEVIEKLFAELASFGDMLEIEDAERARELLSTL